MNPDSRCSRSRTRRPGSRSGSGRTRAASASVSSRMFKPSPAVERHERDERHERLALQQTNREPEIGGEAIEHTGSVGCAASVVPRGSRRRRREVGRRGNGTPRSRSSREPTRHSGGASGELFDHIADDSFALVGLSECSCSQSATRGGPDHPRPRCTSSSIPATCASVLRGSAASAAVPAGRRRK